jgi:hypothetical protein
MYKSILGESENILSDNNFSGDVSNIDMHELVQFLCGMKKNLTVEILTNNDSGQIMIREGNIINAVYQEFDPYESLYLLLNLNEGEFFVNEGVLSPDVKIKGSLESLLLNSAYYKDAGIVTYPDEN